MIHHEAHIVTRVSFAPHRNKLNPYQQLLVDGLKNIGIEVEFEHDLHQFNGGPRKDARPLMQKVYHILHIHWLHPFIIRDKQVETECQGRQLVEDLSRIKQAGTQIVWTVHNLHNHERRHVRTEQKFSKLVAKLCDALIVHSETAKELVCSCLKVPSEKIYVIPMGHYRDCYPNRVSRGEARERLGVSGFHTVLLYFGMVREYKGLPELLEAFKRVDEQRMALVVAGLPISQRLIELVHKASKGDPRIIPVLKWIPNDEVDLYFNSADVVVLPLREALTTSSAVLAMSYGKAIIGPKMNALTDVVPESGAIYYLPRSIDGLAQALRNALLTDLPALGHANLKYINQFTWEKVAHLTRRVYDQVAGIR